MGVKRPLGNRKGFQGGEKKKESRIDVGEGGGRGGGEKVKRNCMAERSNRLGGIGRQELNTHIVGEKHWGDIAKGKKLPRDRCRRGKNSGEERSRGLWKCQGRARGGEIPEKGRGSQEGLKKLTKKLMRRVKSALGGKKKEQ